MLPAEPAGRGRGTQAARLDLTVGEVLGGEEGFRLRPGGEGAVPTNGRAEALSRNGARRGNPAERALIALAERGQRSGPGPPMTAGWTGYIYCGLHAKQYCLPCTVTIGPRGL